MSKVTVIARAQKHANKTGRTFHIYTRNEECEAVPMDIRHWPLNGPKCLWTFDSSVTPRVS